MRHLPGSLLQIGIAALLLAAALPCQNLLLRLRKASIPYRPEELRDAPPSVAFTTVALGSARGIVADLLWLRSFDMQADGRYFELTQLARWITALAANEPQTWTQQAWNLTYNIPPILADPNEKWHWVKSGISLLRKDGVLNAASPVLFAELAFMHADKLGGTVDPSSSLYNRRFRNEISPLLTENGSLPPPGDPRRTPLENTYRLIPDIIQQLESHYNCKLNWRNPHSHAAYWAFRGKQAAPPENPSKRCNRLLYQAFASLYTRRGSQRTKPELSPVNPAFFAPAMHAHREAANNFPDDSIMKSTLGAFLYRASQQLTQAGRPDLAEQASTELKQLFPEYKPSE
jgi:hypothetical protein